MHLQSGNIALRAVEPSDSDLLYQWENDIALWMVSDRLAPVSKFEIEQFILNSSEVRHQSQIRLMVELNENHSTKTIGTVDIYDFDLYHSRAGVGIFIIEELRQKGYAKTAVRLAETYCFDTLGLHQLYAIVGGHNIHSMRLFTKLGYRETGTRTDWYHTSDGYENQHCFQKTIFEFQQLKTR